MAAGSTPCATSSRLQRLAQQQVARQQRVGAGALWMP